jgi:serine/threonine protein kinase
MPVAIKMLKHNVAMDPEYVQTFQDEARITAQLNHENIVKVYDIEERYQTLFIVMEYFDGVSLAEVLAQTKRLPLPKALNILMQICTGLGYGHEHGIIHQDIKPENIYLQHDLVKILDFGLACRPGSRDDFMPGTAFYMAPEQINGDRVDERTDIYATGMTAYELVTGEKPFPFDDAAELLEAQLNWDIPDPRYLVPELPAEFYTILLTATKKDPNERYKSVWELLHAFRLLYEKITAQAHSEKSRQRQMMGFFLFYHDEMQPSINGIVKDISRRAAQIGASLRTIDLHDA